MLIVPVKRRNRLLGRAVGAKIPIRDDAGAERTLATFQRGETPVADHRVVAGALARLRSEAAPRSGGTVRLAAVLITVVAALVVPGLVFGSITIWRLRALPPWALLGLLLSAVVSSVMVLGTVIPRIAARSLLSRADLVADALLRMRRCASCGYPLEADDRPGDGLVTCSECGATWRESRVGPEGAPSDPEASPTGFEGLLMASASCRSRRRDAAGRPWAEPPRLPHSSLSLPGDRAVSRRTIGFVLGVALSAPAAVVLAVLGILAWVRWSPWWTLAPVSGAAIAILLLGHLAGRIAGRTMRVLLAYRRCPACRQRLRRDGALLRCDACDATWDRPHGRLHPARAGR